ncbi:MAG: DNA-processing protein DprA [Candidatus Kapaibacterium sp.]|jgi:predicted Rossmann fold nucleotide-binding protein DprA/Smf involved in DNA uptake|nr:DNA-binding protein [Candidatus Kapabacteria bacterium]
MALKYRGNIDLIKLPKTAFLCSRTVPASAVLACYDWAIQQREQGHCVISGFHSPIEKDVLHYLLKGTQPIIVVLARGFKETMNHEFIKPLEQGKLLIISPFDAQVKRITSRTVLVRHQTMIDLADDIAVGYISKNGQLDTLLTPVTKPIFHITAIPQ